jgi:hypothetical protein
MAGAEFGFAVSGAGDINNDAFDDLIFSAPRQATMRPHQEPVKPCATRGQ